MSDWIPVPQFENVLIVMAELADSAEAIAEAPAMPFLEELKQWQGGTVYLFHAPPEAGEVLEDADPDMTARFAMAAQMSDVQAEAVRDALRRVFSRSVVQRVLVVSASAGPKSLKVIDALFADLAEADLVWAGEWPRDYAVGMKQYYGEIFSALDRADANLRKSVIDEAERLNLLLVQHDVV